jgi:hypothetical protein
MARKPRPVPNIIEDADELPDDAADDRSNFNLGEGGRWVPPSPTEDDE